MALCCIWTLLCKGYLLFWLVLYLWLCYCSLCINLFCADCYDQSVIACVLQFYASRPQMECSRACLVKNGCAWRDFKYCMKDRANCPCCVIKKDINIIWGSWFGHINFSCAQHLSDDLVRAFQYSICSWILNHGWLILYTIHLAQVFKVQF